MKDLAACISFFEAIMKAKHQDPWKLYERACRCSVELLAMKSICAQHPDLLSLAPDKSLKFSGNKGGKNIPPTREHSLSESDPNFDGKDMKTT